MPRGSWRRRRSPSDVARTLTVGLSERRLSAEHRTAMADVGSVSDVSMGPQRSRRRRTELHQHSSIGMFMRARRALVAVVVVVIVLTGVTGCTQADSVHTGKEGAHSGRSATALVIHSLSVRGNHLVNQNEDIVRLTGVNRSGA